MKVAIIGGGPAGLYAAILLKKQRPQAEITVYERNRADDTFGFGVVFSDATLDGLAQADAETHAQITRAFAHSTGSRFGTAVSVALISPVEYSVVINSEPSTPSTSWAMLVPKRLLPAGS